MTTTNGLDAQKRVYAVWAKFYDRIYQGLLARAQREAVAAACASGREILEIGVGTGLTLAYFERDKQVVGADLSLDMLRVARAKVLSQNLDHVRGLMVMDACRLGFADNSFDAVTAQFVITLVPDRHDDGTNVIALPAGLGFRFAYGPGSFRQHVAEARRHGVGVRVWREPRLGLDVDLPEDLDEPQVREVLPWLPTIPASHP